MRILEEHPAMVITGIYLYISTIGVINPKKKKLVWALTQAWRHQHDPTLLPNCMMLLFDNNAGFLPYNREQYSQIIEFNPLTQQTIWVYKGTKNKPLYSSLMGAVQRLPNGNTLITESDFGRAC